MQTRIAEFIKTRPESKELEHILRSCVHCGFCNATCPTYQLTGNELDGPRGRIYLLKQLCEGEPVSRLSHYHLDRCLSCRSCETTCPSAVKYSRLFDLGKTLLSERQSNTVEVRLKKFLMRWAFSSPQRFSKLIGAARIMRPVLPKLIRNKIPAGKAIPSTDILHYHKRKILLLNHCVQGSLAPEIDTKVMLVLDKLSITSIQVKASTCCGALNYHLSAHKAAVQQAKQNIDACWPLIEQGAEAIISSASGCGLMLKEYGQLLQFDSEYAEKAAKFSAMTLDISEILVKEDLSRFKTDQAQSIAFHAPCTLQHGQHLNSAVETILLDLGYTLNPVSDSHLCCGSAGVYSLLQPELAKRLREDKISALTALPAEYIATANIGCLYHLKPASDKPVVHWIQLLRC